jgi:hypothetical protein
MGGLPGLNRYAHYKEYSLYGGSLYRGTTVLLKILIQMKPIFLSLFLKIYLNS